VDVPIASILILNTIANTAGAFFAGTSYGYVFDPATEWIFMIVFTVTILLVGEIIPKTIGVTNAGRLAVPVAIGVRVLVWILTPALIFTRLVSGALRRGGEAQATSVEEIRLLASLGRTQGAVTKRTHEIIEGAVALRELTAYDVMVPRNGVAFLSGERTLEQNLNVVRRTGHSRFPFTRNGNLDDAEGIVLTKDLMFQLLETQNDPAWMSLVGPMVVVPAAMPLERLLRKFQEERRHLAIVVDEYGGTQGLVTLEDVLEELVGEIEDESDRVERFIIRRPDGALICRGWAETRRVFEELHLEDETIEATTIGGFVADLVGRVPQTGDEVEWIGFRFKVLRASPRRAERIEVRSVDPRRSMPPGVGNY
jgi:CBS domain containing-hemolysin-like protein